MWNRPQSDSETALPAQPEPPFSRTRGDRQAVLGPSITIKGNLSGDEDLLIEGQVEGKISFKAHSVTVGKSGRIKADLYCRSIYVEGEVEGNLYGDELVAIRQSGKVQGNAVAPRISLEDGARFQGNIDMQPKELSRPGTPTSGRKRGSPTEGKDTSEGAEKPSLTADPSDPKV